MKHILLSGLCLFTLGLPASAGGAPAGGFCILNASDEARLFATETREGARQSAMLAPGEQLCASGSTASDGIVSVFADAEGFEGCSRIVPLGVVEEMREYAEFDRCRWSDHDG